MSECNRYGQPSSKFYLAAMLTRFNHLSHLIDRSLEIHKAKVKTQPISGGFRLPISLWYLGRGTTHAGSRSGER